MGIGRLSTARLKVETGESGRVKSGEGNEEIAEEMGVSGSGVRM